MSDARNRDDSLERLLRKAKPMLGGTETPEACLDAETVAAWAAGGLSPDEFERAQEHTAGCTRCQALVALMVRIDPATAVDEVPAPRSRAWIGWVVPLAAAAGLVLFLMTRPPGPLAPLSEAISPAPASAPLGAGQGAGQQEIAVPSTRAQAASPAEVPPRPPAAGAPATSTAGGVNAAPVDAMPPAEAAQLRQSRLADARAAAKAGGGATAGQGAGTDLARAAENRPMQVGQGQAGSVGAMFRSAGGGMTAPPPAGAAATPSPTPAAAPAPVTTLRESVTIAAPPPAPAPSAPAPPPPPAATPPTQQAQQAQTATFIGAGRGGAGGRGGGAAGGGGGGGRAAGAIGGAASASVALDAVAPRVVLVSSPNSAVRWRATGALVERSTDSGATWQFVARLVDADLRAASSPSPLVCWLVGRDGKVVVFTEGRTAREVTFPEMIDLTTVRATDDQIATVTAANGREYVTINGGLSWNTR